MKPIKYLIVTDKPDLFETREDQKILTPEEFIGLEIPTSKQKRKPKVINLSNRYAYQRKGYYVSLLAEARGMHCIPDVSNILSLEWKRNYDYALPELNALLEKNYKAPAEEPLSRIYTSFFGRHKTQEIETIARRIFDLFRYPIFSFEVKYAQSEKWEITKIEAITLSSLTKGQTQEFKDSLAAFTGAAWKSRKNIKQERYWIAILHDPKETTPPSNKAALKKFINAGKKMNLWIELITKSDFHSLLEYDALLIRETTAINNHTYRFANKAEQEGIPCIDDTTSIIRCCNKVFLKELLEANKIPVPKTVIFDKKNIAKIEKEIAFPMVLKVPDSEFCKGVKKVNNTKELTIQANLMLQKSDIILCQEFTPSTYDWRIGVLDNEPLFASKYYMAEGHWQVYNNDAKNKKNREGNDDCVPLSDVPENVLNTALAAAKTIGNGLYGVDLKELKDGRIVVIEVNDNPNIDAGIEDKISGEEIYTKILTNLVKQIES